MTDDYSDLYTPEVMSLMLPNAEAKPTFTATEALAIRQSEMRQLQQAPLRADSVVTQTDLFGAPADNDGQLRLM